MRIFNKPYPNKSNTEQSNQGLYDPAYESDACGVGFVVDIKGRKSHKIVENAVTIFYEVEFDYIQMNHVMGLIKQFDIKIINQVQEMNCLFLLEIELKHQAAFLLKMTDNVTIKEV